MRSFFQDIFRNVSVFQIRINRSEKQMRKNR